MKRSPSPATRNSSARDADVPTRPRNIAAATIPALILAAALVAPVLVATAPQAHADGGREGGACRRGASLANTPQPAIMAPATIATAASPATLDAAAGMVQIPGLRPRGDGGCEGGSEGEHHAHRPEHEAGRAHTDD